MIRKVDRFTVFCLSFFLFFHLAAHISGQVQKSERPVYGGVFRIKSLSDTFRMQLDPAQPDSYIFLSQQLYDGLVRLDKNLKIAPSLADYWSISSDGEKYTFFLKKGVRFHNGEELTAWDVKFSLERILDPESDSPYFQLFLDRIVGARDFRAGKTEEVAGIKVVNRYTLEIDWTSPYVPALYLLNMHFCKILPRERLSSQGQNFFLKPVGTGPFKFDYWLRDTRLNEVGVRMVRNEEYFMGKPYLDALEFCPLYNLDHFVNEEIDSLPVLSERLLRSRYRIFRDGSLRCASLGMSCRIPPLDRPAVRRAIGAGIDKKKLVEAVREPRYLRTVVHRFISPQIPGFLPVDDPGTFDRDKARQGLNEAGFAPEGFPSLTLYLDFPRTDFKHSFYRELKNQLGELGIDLKVRYYKSLEEVKRSGEPYLLLIDRMMNMPDPEDIIRPLFY
jgi:ABC-type transport system substrate-binding protein